MLKRWLIWLNWRSLKLYRRDRCPHGDSFKWMPADKGPNGWCGYHQLGMVRGLRYRIGSTSPEPVQGVTS
jgi:hypothetical protein